MDKNYEEMAIMSSQLEIDLLLIQLTQLLNYRAEVSKQYLNLKTRVVEEILDDTNDKIKTLLILWN